MLWQEQTEETRFKVPETIVDLSFRLHCQRPPSAIPVDHAQALSDAVTMALPWIAGEPLAGIHSIYGAATGNGWNRPDNQPGNEMPISARTRLVLRLPAERCEDARALEGRVLELERQSLEVGTASNKPLVATRTVFSRSVTIDGVDDENRFSVTLANMLLDQGISVSKLLCGRLHSVNIANTAVAARSVMIADLSFEDAVSIQQRGIGQHKLHGCGLFLPHKSIAAVGSSQQ